MKDIPLFTTEYGIASLTLREIPYTARSYVTLRSSSDPMALLAECVQFCRMCGAQEIFASGAELPYPLHASIVELRRDVAGLPKDTAALFPVQAHTAGEFRKIYNEKMKNVPNAAYMTAQDEKELLEKGDGYFVHENGVLLGIGRASLGRLDALAAVQKGAGERVLCTLAHGLCGETAVLEVARENEPAMELYKRLGFIPVREVSRWHKVL